MICLFPTGNFIVNTFGVLTKDCCTRRQFNSSINTAIQRLTLNHLWHKQTNLLWVTHRKHSASTGQEVSGWAGYISAAGNKPAQTTTIKYYPAINHPITDFKAVQECLRYLEEASKEIGQWYVITTLDLGVCMKAHPLLWRHPDKYKNPHCYELILSCYL